MRPTWAEISLTALRHRISLMANLRDDEGALRAANQAAELYPESAFARVLKARCLARLGRRDEAVKEAEACLKLTSNDPGVLFEAGCVYARTSQTHPEDRKLAFDLLKKATRAGYVKVRSYEVDQDLTPIRSLPEFDALLRAIKELVL